MPRLCCTESAAAQACEACAACPTPARSSRAAACGWFGRCSKRPARRSKSSVAVRVLPRSQDSSNTTAEFTRGRIRNVVLPHLREMLNPNVSDALLRLAEQARWLGTYLEDAAERTFESLLISETPRHIVLNTRALLAKQKIIQAEVVRRAISLVLGGEQDLGFSHVDAVLRLAADKASGKELHLPGAVLARKRYERLEFRPLTDSNAETWPELTPVFVACPGRTPLPALGGELAAELCDVDPSRIGALRRRPIRLRSGSISSGCGRRCWCAGRRDGDRFRPLGRRGPRR